MVSILTEPGFDRSTWCTTILENLIEQLRNKRIPFHPPAETLAADSHSAFLIASDPAWIQAAVMALNRANIHPILICSQPERIPGCVYSCVCSDVNAAMRQLLALVAAEGRDRVAVYGVNPNSVGDLNRVDGLFLSKAKTVQLEIFLNDGSLDQCFRAFSPKVQQFDAVICANNYAAISLCRHLGKVPEHLRIYSCVKSPISEHYREEIYFLDTNTLQFGRAAVSLYETLRKNPSLSCLTWYVKPLPIPPEPEPELPKLPGLPDSKFYADREIQQILCADRLLFGTDETDMQILQGLLAGNSIAKLAEENFLSESAVKYRRKKMEALCGVSTHEELLALAKELLRL